MGTVTNANRIQDINIALVAHDKHLAGDKLNRKEKQAVSNFSDMYLDIVGDELTPAVKTALKGVLQDSDYGKVTENVLLTKHLAGLRNRGCATDTEVSQIKKFAAKLSQSEDNAISATLAELTLNKGISDSAVKDIKSYLDQERSERGSFVRNRKLMTAGIAASTLVGGALAGPLLLWIPAVTAAVGGMAGGAATAVSLGTLVGGAFAGGAAGKIAGANLSNAAKNYGVND